MVDEAYELAEACRAQKDIGHQLVEASRGYFPTSGEMMVDLAERYLAARDRRAKAIEAFEAAHPAHR